jgi:MFS family permease
MKKKCPYQLLLGIFIYILATIFLIYEMALQVSPSIITHDLMRDFQVHAKSLGIIASCYFYSYTLMQIPVGLLYDRYGPRLLISGAAFICGVGAFFFGATSQVYFAAFGRFFMGIGSAFAFVGVLVVATRWFPPYYFAFLVGIAQFLAALGALGGELPLAFLVNRFGWREMMMFAGVIGLIIAGISALFIRNTPSSKVLFTKPSHHLKRELKKIFHFSQTWWILLYAFSNWGPVTIFAALWGVPYLMLKYGISNTQAALGCAMIWIGIGIMSPLLGWLSDKMGRRKILLTLCGVLGCISSFIALYFPNLPFRVALIFFFLMGVASSGQILTFALVKDHHSHRQIGTAIGLNNMAVVMGGALLQPFVGYLLDRFWSGKLEGGLPLYSIGDYHIGLSIVPLCFFIGTLVSRFFIQETYCRSRS